MLINVTLVKKYIVYVGSLNWQCLPNLSLEVWQGVWLVKGEGGGQAEYGGLYCRGN